MEHARESAVAAWDEALPLHALEDAEVGSLGMRNLPDPKIYAELERMGMVAFFTARNEGKLCGYALFYIGPNPNYTAKRIAHDQALYMVHEHRGIAAAKFLLWTDEQLKAMGVEHIIRTCTAKNDLGSMYARMGYEPLEQTYLRSL